MNEQVSRRWRAYANAQRGAWDEIGKAIEVVAAVAEETGDARLRWYKDVMKIVELALLEDAVIRLHQRALAPIDALEPCLVEGAQAAFELEHLQAVAVFVQSETHRALAPGLGEGDHPVTAPHIVIRRDDRAPQMLERPARADRAQVRPTKTAFGPDAVAREAVAFLAK